MGIVRMGPPSELITRLRREFDIGQFIETGTYMGDTARWAANDFRKVITIEFSKEIYDQVAKEGANDEKIDYIYGDSRSALKTILPKMEESAIFWLDSHWSGGATYGKEDECPLIDEIGIINDTGKEHFLLIDDARLFMSPPPEPHDPAEWPTIDRVLAIKSGKHNCYIVIIEDVIVAVPLYAKALVESYCQEVNTSAWKKYGEEQLKSEAKKKEGHSLVGRALKLIFSR